MRNPRVASRYAKALISLSKERNELDATKNDVEVVLAALKESRELRVLLSSPVVKPEKKQAILIEVFSKSIGELSMSFINLLVSHHREQFTAEVFKSFVNQYLVVKNIVKASVTTAVELDDALKAEFTAMIKAAENDKEVIIEEHVNADLIGGFVVRVGDNEYDSSIAGKLKKLSREFEENPYVSEL